MIIEFRKPQVLLREEDKYGVHFIKKWFHPENDYFAIEGHTVEGAKSHNANVPSYFFPVDEQYVSDAFNKAGREWIVK